MTLSESFTVLRVSVDSLPCIYIGLELSSMIWRTPSSPLKVTVHNRHTQRILIPTYLYPKKLMSNMNVMPPLAPLLLIEMTYDDTY